MYSYPQELEKLHKGLPVSNTSSLLALSPLLGEDGLIRVGGRLENLDLPYFSTHPIILDKKSHITRLLVEQAHLRTKHAGLNIMLATLAHKYHVVEIKQLLRTVSKFCVVCQ